MHRTTKKKTLRNRLNRVEQRGAVLITALVLMTAILVVATSSALYSSAAQHRIGNWTDRQQTLSLANATTKAAQANITTLLAGVTSDAAVPAAITAAGSGFYSGLASAPAWSPWPANASVLSVAPINGMPQASYFVIYTGSVPVPSKSMTAPGVFGGTVKHQFLIVVNAPGVRSGSNVMLETGYTAALPS